MKFISEYDVTAWHAALPNVVSEMGNDRFYRSLDEALNGLSSFDLSCIFAYPADGQPQLLYDGLKDVSSREIMRNYLSGTYLFDAVYDACCRQVARGLYRLKALAPDDFFRGHYYNSPEFHPCISMQTGSLAEEIVFIIPSHNAYLAYSLLRQRQQQPFSDRDFGTLEKTAAMVASLVVKHQEHCDRSDAGPPKSQETSDRVIHAFESFADGTLTLRERLIVKLILKGHSSISTAAVLGITEGTVKNHRKRIYAKLRISSQTELFNLFIHHLFKK